MDGVMDGGTESATRPMPGIATRLARWVRLEADEWGVSTRTAWALALVPLAFAAMVGVTAAFRPLYRVFVNEDALVEWLQFFVVVALVPVGLLIARRLLAQRQPALAAVFVVAAIGAVFIAGEEISWGQRLLGWSTPDGLSELNEQGETTIHNIGNVLQVMNLVMFLTAVIAGLAPFVWRRGVGQRHRGLAQLIYVPPLFLATSFLFAAAYRLFRYALMPDARYTLSRYGEVGELLLYGAFLAFAILLYRRLVRPATA